MSIYSRVAIPRSRLKRHAPKRRPGHVDREYIWWIKMLPCAVPDCSSHVLCDWAREQHPEAVTEAHHAGDHGYAQRAPDRTCIPLCAWHHREGPYSAHVLGKRFWEHHGLDRDALVRSLNETYDTTH